MRITPDGEHDNFIDTGIAASIIDPLSGTPLRHTNNEADDHEFGDDDELDGDRDPEQDVDTEYDY